MRGFLSIPVIAVLLATVIAKQGVASENGAPSVQIMNEEFQGILSSNEIVVRLLEQQEAYKKLLVQLLNRKKAARLREIADDLKKQGLSTGDFNAFLSWMNSNLASYNRYIQAGSYAAFVVKFLPVPYAGQASMFTKFVTQFTASVNSAAIAVSNYQKSSLRFLSMVEALDRSNGNFEKQLAEAATFADQTLLKDMNEAEIRLATVADFSAGALAFLESVCQYAENGDEYWSKTREILGKDTGRKEKSLISSHLESLKSHAAAFNKKTGAFGELAKKEAFSIKSLAVYDELANEIISFK